MTRTEALDRDKPISTKVDIVSATGSDGETWYLCHRMPGYQDWTNRLEWRLSTLLPEGGFWHGVDCELEPEGVDWVPSTFMPGPPSLRQAQDHSSGR